MEAPVKKQRSNQKRALFVDVRFLRPCPSSAYFPGDLGIVNIKNVFNMVMDGYVKVEFRKSLSRGLRSILKKKVS
jgi:hypothetical protein